MCFSENVDNTLLRCQTLQLNVHNSDAVIGSLTGSGTSSSGMPCSSSAGIVGGSAVVGNAASGPQYDISFVFQDNNKLAKNAKRSYESQVCDVTASVISVCFVLFCFIIL